MASPNLSELITTTLRNRSGKLADNVTANTALLYRLRKKGKVRTFSGGRTIVQPLSYQENGTFQYYSGWDTLNTSLSDVISAAEFNIKQAAVSVSISGLEQLQNASKEQVIDLLESRIEVAEATLTNNISVGVYSDGTGSGGKQIDGLQSLVADTPTSGNPGGISRSTFSFWKNISYDATTDGGSAASSSNIQSYMNRVYLQLVRNSDAPDLIAADNNYYRLYLESLQLIQRISSEEMAQAGFQTLKYMGADVVLDGGQGGDAPTNHMYFLNTNYLFFRPHSARNFTVLEPGERVSLNQDGITKFLVFAGNLTMSNASLQGVLKD